MTDYDVLPATIEDVPEIVEVFYAAFADDDIMGNTERNVDPAIRTARSAKFHRQNFENAHLNGARYFKAVEKSTGKIAAFGKWEFPVTLTAEQKEEKRILQEQMAAEPQAPGTNVSLRKDFIGQLNEKRKLYRDPEKDYFMHLLATHPSHHRRGLGSRILLEGLRCADRDGAKSYIEASRPGVELYKRHGWVQVDEVVVDLAKHGLPDLGVYVEPAFIRQPQKRKGAAEKDAEVLAEATHEELVG